MQFGPDALGLLSVSVLNAHAFVCYSSVVIWLIFWYSWLLDLYLFYVAQILWCHKGVLYSSLFLSNLTMTGICLDG
jgi:hypothetical protein